MFLPTCFLKFKKKEMTDAPEGITLLSYKKHCDLAGNAETSCSSKGVVVEKDPPSSLPSIASPMDFPVIPESTECFLGDYFFEVAFTLDGIDLKNLSIKTGLPISQLENWFSKQDKLEKLKARYRKRGSEESAEELAKVRICLDDLEQKVNGLMKETAMETGLSEEYVSYWLRKRASNFEKAERKLFRRPLEVVKSKAHEDHISEGMLDFRVISSPSFSRELLSGIPRHSYRSVRSMKRDIENRMVRTQSTTSCVTPTSAKDNAINLDLQSPDTASYHASSTPASPVNASYDFLEITV